jgi:hypothetical protein
MKARYDNHLHHIRVITCLDISYVLPNVWLFGTRPSFESLDLLHYLILYPETTRSNWHQRKSKLLHGKHYF